MPQDRCTGRDGSKMMADDADFEEQANEEEPVFQEAINRR